MPDAAKALKTAFENYHSDGDLFYDAPDLNKVKSPYFIRNYQVAGDSERASLGDTFRERQTVVSVFEVWSQAADGDGKHFALLQSIFSFIITKTVAGLGKLASPQVLQSKQISAVSSNWMVSVITQDYYLDNVRKTDGA